MEEIEETDSNQQLCNKLIEEIMAECGDLILKIFHKQNLTYSRGINFENLLDIIRESHDQESEVILNKIQKTLMSLPTSVFQFVHIYSFTLHKKPA